MIRRGMPSRKLKLLEMREAITRVFKRKPPTVIGSVRRKVEMEPEFERGDADVLQPLFQILGKAILKDLGT
jgi:hypothetical protein